MRRNCCKVAPYFGDFILVPINLVDKTNNNNNNAGMAFSDSVVYVVELVLFCDFCYAYRSCQLLLSGKLNL